mgnify:FL=1
MYCLNCGKELRPGVAFCASCGAPVQAQGAPQSAGAAPAPQVAPAAVPVAQSAPQATVSPGAFAPQGVAQPYGQQPYGGFTAAVGTVAGPVGAASGLSFSRLIAIAAAIAGIFLFVFSPWLELPIIPLARTLGYSSLFTGAPSSLRMGSIVSLNDLYSVWLGQAFQGSSVPVSVNSTISGGSMTFVCVVWQLSIIFTSYCVVSAIRHKGEVLPLRIALGVMAAIALFWIISVSMANGSIISELRMHYSSSSSSYAQLLYTESVIAPAWGAIVSLIVCGLGLVGSIFFGIGERQRR